MGAENVWSRTARSGGRSRELGDSGWIVKIGNEKRQGRSRDRRDGDDDVGSKRAQSGRVWKGGRGCRLDGAGDGADKRVSGCCAALGLCQASERGGVLAPGSGSATWRDFCSLWRLVFSILSVEWAFTTGDEVLF